MPDYYFHYTSRMAAQSILSSGRLEAGISGLIYLSLDVYGEGARAVDTLALVDKPIEVVGVVPAAVASGALIRYVLPLYDPVSGMLVRKGGGTQITIPGPLPGADIRWLVLSLP